MKVLSIVTYPASVLTTPTKKVGDLTKLQELIDQMVVAMHKAKGVGLAATQIGQGIRLCILEHIPDRDEDPLDAVPLQVLANAKVISAGGGDEVLNEGCLSLPGIEVPVSRPRKIKVKGLDRDGRPIQFRAAGFHARIIQHELDHLDGILITDHAKRPERKIAEYLAIQAKERQ